MGDFLDTLARDAQITIASGYYTSPTRSWAPSVSLKKAILASNLCPVIGEIKPASPSAGTIREDLEAEKLAKDIEKGGAVGISVLTEPRYFKGSLDSLTEVRRAVRLPILMKDIILSSVQIEAASNVGADAILLIQAIFDRGYCSCDVHEMLVEAHSRKLEVLLETHNDEEFRFAVNSDADLVGINNRNLRTLSVNLNVTREILERNEKKGKIIVSESGIKTPADIRFLRECGADAFLVGSALMLAGDVEAKVREFVQAP
jgi:indole-3-glycerol phosphate synthase